MSVCGMNSEPLIEPSSSLARLQKLLTRTRRSVSGEVLLVNEDKLAELLALRRLEWERSRIAK